MPQPPLCLKSLLPNHKGINYAKNGLGGWVELLLEAKIGAKELLDPNLSLKKKLTMESDWEGKVSNPKL